MSIRSAIDDMSLLRCGIPAIWNKLAPLKVRLCFWRARLCRLPTKDNLVKRGLNISDDTCVLCKESCETEDQIFTTCRKAIEVRRAVNVWARLLPTQCTKVMEIDDEVSTSDQAKGVRVLKQVTGQACVWNSWNGHNDAIFKNKEFNPLRTAIDIQASVFEFFGSRREGVGVVVSIGINGVVTPLL